MWSRSLSRRARTRAVSLIAACALLAPGAAAAATFSVDPISVTLVKGDSSATIAVVNQSGAKLRLQVTGFAWTQSTSGEIKLAPTDDLVFFPQLLSLDPGETKRIRVGVTSAQGAAEKTFRVFMEELPSLASVLTPASGPQLTIRMKIGVPVFVRPLGPATVSGEARNVAVRGGSLQFDIANTGNVHFSIQDVRIAAKAASGAAAFSQDLSGWYVLAGETRHYVVPLSKDRCGSLASLTIATKTDAGSFKNAFSNVQKDCSAAAHR
ncbi:MAG TPA: fimbria/pilus periplasmic chaperone [Candidatus Baltobacteraceae bacterium]|jgi:fimbrial chaperone protein